MKLPMIFFMREQHEKLKHKITEKVFHFLAQAGRNARDVKRGRFSSTQFLDEKGKKVAGQGRHQ